jgi:hypothetical protein
MYCFREQKEGDRTRWRWTGAGEQLHADLGENEKDVS